MLDRAYALLSIKALDPERRRITGIASTPTPDRLGDVIEPLGATFTNPLPLLLHHDRERPVGRVTLTATRAGIAFDATLPDLADPGVVRDRVNEAWHLIKAGLITGVSIGFRPLADGIKQLASGGLHLVKTEICELSLVTIPANVDTTIQAIKSFDAPHLAASGLTPPGVSGLPPSPRPIIMKLTAPEQISQLDAKRTTLATRMTEIMQASADAEQTLTTEQAEEHDRLSAQVKSLDADLVRWRDLEQLQIKQATPVPPAPIAPTPRPSLPQVSVKPNVPLGMPFVRQAMALLVCHGNKYEAAEYAKRWDDSTPEVALSLKAAIAPGTTTDATWAQPLVQQSMINDFIELLRPATILGKIPGLRNVPFNTKIPMQTAGGSYGWVGEAKPKPLTKLAFSSDTLGMTKVAGIVVLTEELVRSSNPSAEALVRADMVAGIAQFLDAQFIDPAVAAVAGVNPASITNGAPTAVATANPLADIMGLINHFATNNIPIDGVTFILSAANALALSFRTNLDGSPEFPGVGIGGGTYKGLSFITSNTAVANVVALQPSLVLYADDGGVTIDASREASLQMDSAPMSPADATTVYVSLFQTNSVALRAERFINWKRVSANAVKYLTAAAWPAPTGGLTLRSGDEPREDEPRGRNHRSAS
jgi:HK97 family phage major capsid protein/HK97 family phage prohead protease